MADLEYIDNNDPKVREKLEEDFEFLKEHFEVSPDIVVFKNLEGKTCIAPQTKKQIFFHKKEFDLAKFGEWDMFSNKRKLIVIYGGIEKEYVICRYPLKP